MPPHAADVVVLYGWQRFHRCTEGGGSGAGGGGGGRGGGDGGLGEHGGSLASKAVQQSFVLPFKLYTVALHGISAHSTQLALLFFPPQSGSPSTCCESQTKGVGFAHHSPGRPHWWHT